MKKRIIEKVKKNNGRKIYSEIEMIELADNVFNLIFGSINISIDSYPELKSIEQIEDIIAEIISSKIKER